MCQTVGKCFIEDPLAKRKDAIWEARRFVETKPEGSYSDFDAYLQSKGILPPYDVLKADIGEALTFLKTRDRGPERQQAFEKILSLFPEP
jgi:hypothetical protein